MEIIAKYFLLALCYAFGGWICEEITCSISEKKLVDRGFLIGPVCPIYGWGGLFITFMCNLRIFNKLFYGEDI